MSAYLGATFYLLRLTSLHPLKPKHTYHLAAHETELSPFV